MFKSASSTATCFRRRYSCDRSTKISHQTSNIGLQSQAIGNSLVVPTGGTGMPLPLRFKTISSCTGHSLNLDSLKCRFRFSLYPHRDFKNGENTVDGLRVLAGENNLKKITRGGGYKKTQVRGVDYSCAIVHWFDWVSAGSDAALVSSLGG